MKNTKQQPNNRNLNTHTKYALRIWNTEFSIYIFVYWKPQKKKRKTANEKKYNNGKTKINKTKQKTNVS